jgi:ABC-type glycerol-3-phosphate transport system substrate-binding protein
MDRLLLISTTGYTRKNRHSYHQGFLRVLRVLSVLYFILSLAACSAAPSLNFNPVPSNTPPLTPSATSDLDAPEATSTSEQTMRLRVWLPPQFDPNTNTPAGQILKTRLQQFQTKRPDVIVEVRVKAVAGPGGLLDALTTASAAAPAALPDLVALPRDVLETAALKGLLHPYNNLTGSLDDTDWYDYARSLGKIQQDVYGLPFAGDALALAYRPSSVPTPPVQWRQVITQASPLVFAAADPQARMTIALYQSLGAGWRDEQGRPSLDSLALTQVFEFYARSEETGGMPEWLTQLQSEDQVWEAYHQGRADMAVISVGRYLSAPENDAELTLLPTVDGSPFTQATGWVWGLPARGGERQSAAVALAEFLTDSRFLAGWTAAAGLLPTRPSALRMWEKSSLRTTLERIARSAQIAPTADVTSAFSGPVWQATLDVLKRQSDPAAAAQSAATSLSNP